LAYTPAVPRLNRCYGHGFLHFITFSCYHRLPLLRREPRRDLFLRILEQVRRNYRFVVVGYVVMPEHVHLLLSEPERADPGTVVQVLKQRFARTVLRELRGRRKPEQAALWNEPLTQSRVWQARFYDFLVYTKKKRMEKLHYMHRNPVARGLVLEPQQWAWSSFRDYVSDVRGPVLVNELVRAEMKVCARPQDDSSVA
jgi:putative transposase